MSYDYAELVMAGEGTIAPVGAPVLLSSTNANVTQSSIASNSISPAANSTLYAVLRTRYQATRAHQAPTTSGLTNLGAWSLVSDGSTTADKEQSNSGNTIFLHTSVWQAKVTGAAGTGVVTGHMGGTTFQQELEVYAVPNANPNARQVTWGSTNETDQSTHAVATFAQAPKSDSLVFGFLGVNSSSTQDRLPDAAGFTEDTDGHISTLGWESQHKLGSAATTCECTGIVATSTTVRTLLALEIPSLG